MALEDRLTALQDLTATQFARLISHFPELEHRGLTLFLGKHYAEPELRIMMLGINPGLDEDLAPDYKLHRVNCFIDDPETEAARKIRFWRNARHCFRTTPELAGLMGFATFAYCAPFRTPRWCHTPRAQQRSIEELSRPILTQMLGDCRPISIVLAGRVAVPLFTRISGISLIPRTLGRLGRHRWGYYVGQGHWGAFDVLQIPHFSIVNSHAILEATGRWLQHRLELRILKEYS